MMMKNNVELVSAAIPLAKLAGDVFTASYVGDSTFGDKIKRKSNSADIERREAVQKQSLLLCFFSSQYFTIDEITEREAKLYNLLSYYCIFGLYSVVTSANNFYWIYNT